MKSAATIFVSFAVIIAAIAPAAYTFVALA